MQVKIEPSGAARVPATPGDDKQSAAASGAPETQVDGAKGRDETGALAAAARLRLSLRALAAQRSAAGEGVVPAFQRGAVDASVLAERIRSNPSGAAVAQGALDPSRALRLLSESGGEIPSTRFAEIATAFENRLAATLEPGEVDQTPAARPLASERIEEIRSRIEAWRASAPWADSLE